MPLKIRRVGSHFQVYNAQTGFVHAKHTTLENAKKQIRLLQMIDREKLKSV